MITNKSWCKIPADLVRVLIFSSDIRLDFHKSIRVVPLKYLMYFSVDINTK